MVDGQVESALWEGIRSHAVADAGKAGGGMILDLGGGPGGFTQYISSRVPNLSPVSIDIVEPDLAPVCEFVLGDAMSLPFGDSTFSAVAARAVLHHFPDRLDQSISEIHRVLSPGGVLIVQEPCAGNLLAAAARTIFPTDRHDPGESPLDAGEMVRAVSRRFGSVFERRYFLATYLAPHLVARMPTAMRPLARGVSLVAYRAEERLLSASAAARRSAAYIHISATKGKK
jgi:ubiquinone/menaquinone biosynthesis C-methylase UbiE